uniref:Uncharacterized protein n=1 Tax=Anguilla anguilla TaxID=7936 RepID=A0A0E9W1W6_ANGAN
MMMMVTMMMMVVTMFHDAVDLCYVDFVLLMMTLLASCLHIVVVLYLHTHVLFILVTCLIL